MFCLYYTKNKYCSNTESFNQKSRTPQVAALFIEYKCRFSGREVAFLCCKSATLACQVWHLGS